MKWDQLMKNISGKHSFEFSDYVIFDDDSDMLLWQKDNFIKIDDYCGLTPSAIYKAE